MTDPDFKDQDDFFPNATRRPANSMSSSKRIYNPSLGFFALRLAAHICDNIDIHAFDLHVLDLNAPYGYRAGRHGMVRHQDHDFVGERQAIPRMLRRCGFSSVNDSSFHWQRYNLPYLT